MKLITKTLAGIASLLLLAPGLNAATVSYYSATDFVQNSPVSFALNQFNTSLGTLTGVQVSVYSSAISGSFTVTNNTSSSSDITAVNSLLSVAEASDTTGYNTYSRGAVVPKTSTITAAYTAPDWFPSYTLSAYQAQAFSIVTSPAQPFSLGGTVVNIDSSFFDAYKGTGNVAFNITDTQQITTTGTSYTVDSGSSGATTQMKVTYTYTAVPEPTTVGLLLGAGGLGIVAAVRRRRAKA